MINFKLGCNFDFKLIDEIKRLNDIYEKSGSRISEFYGSDKLTAKWAARPDFRLSNIKLENLKKFIELTNSIDVEFNFTLNTIYPGKKRDLVDNKHKFQGLVTYLVDIGVKRITIANPVLLDFIREISDISIEISTIAHIDAISQIKYYKEIYNVDKICCNLMKNRSVKFLKIAAKFCNDNDIALELMVNEFCSSGGKDYATHCIYRDSCYLCHAENITKKDDLSINHYPMRYCMTSRNVDSANWLRVRFIRPQDIHYYENIGIKHFKITGRTGTTEYISKMAEAYLKREWNDNLLSLWKPLETITSGQNEFEFKQPANIDTTKLDGFLDHWFDDPNFDCANEVCGTTCRYCHKFWEDHIKNKRTGVGKNDKFI